MSEIKKRFVYVSIVCGVLLSLFSCVSTQGTQVAPEWISSPDAVYPSADYLNGVGAGSTKKDAENEALSYLLRGIVQSVNSVVKTEKTLQGNDTVGYNTDYAYDFSVESSSSLRDIPGISFPEVWVAPNGTYYVLAQLNRNATGKFFQERVSNLSKIVESEIVYADKEKNTLKALRALKNAKEKAYENKENLTALAGINFTMYRMVANDYISPETVEVLLNRTAESIPISVTVQGDSQGRIKSGLLSGLEQAGLKSIRQDSTDGYVLEAVISMEDVESSTKYSYVRYVIDITLTDLKNQEVVFALSDNGREAHMSSSEARQRAYRTIESFIEKEFVQRFSDYIENL